MLSILKLCQIFVIFMLIVRILIMLSVARTLSISNKCYYAEYS
jgi:hypothetical protein